MGNRHIHGKTVRLTLWRVSLIKLWLGISRIHRSSEESTFRNKVNKLEDGNSYYGLNKIHFIKEWILITPITGIF